LGARVDVVEADIAIGSENEQSPLVTAERHGLEKSSDVWKWFTGLAQSVGFQDDSFTTLGVGDHEVLTGDCVCEVAAVELGGDRARCPVASLERGGDGARSCSRSRTLTPRTVDRCTGRGTVEAIDSGARRYSLRVRNTR